VPNLPLNYTLVYKSCSSTKTFITFSKTRSSAIAERLRDASCHAIFC